MSGTALAVVVAYLLGSLPFGYWAGRLAGVDLRQAGSGNTGGSNAVRVLGVRYGVPVILLDVAKGVVAVLIAAQLGGAGTQVLAAVAVVLGHVFPLFLGFRGGKAVATGGGSMLALAPPAGLGIVAVWLAVAFATRYVSLASITAAVSAPTLCLALDEPWPVTLYALVGGMLVILRHRTNIARLRAGTEHRLNLPSLR